jgi:hypothetical protein
MVYPDVKLGEGQGGVDGKEDARARQEVHAVE